MSVLSEPVVAAHALTTALEGLGVRYVVGGSLASSIYGEPRATNDVDIVADLREEHVEPFAKVLGDDFYVDVDMIRDAIARRASFNVIHQPSIFKLDVFVPRFDAWTRSELSRGKRIELPSPAGPVTMCFASAEDAVLHKLVWYRLGDEISDRQWRDVLGVLRVQGAALDNRYLDEWAEPLAVADLLARARREA